MVMEYLINGLHFYLQETKILIALETETVKGSEYTKDDIVNPVLMPMNFQQNDIDPNTPVTIQAKQVS